MRNLNYFLILALAFLLCPNLSRAQVVLNEENFPDANFRAYLVGLGATEGSELSTTILNRTSIYVQSKEISSLKGIEYFTKLKTLFCYANQLTELDVSKNTALTTLRCYTNKLTSLDVSANTLLTDFWCSYNPLTELDVSQNTQLTQLQCSSSNISSIDVSKNTALKTFYIKNAKLTSIDVSKNTELTDFRCDNNALTTLDVSHNTALKTLYCNYNNLSVLDVSAQTALEILFCYSNQLETLVLPATTSLRDLRCGANKLSQLDVSQYVNMTYLTCGDNNLTSLDVSNNTKLTQLQCHSNKLTSLDVSNNTELTLLYCYNQILRTLDVSANTKLTHLHCNNAELSELDLTNNKEIKRLECQSNSLKELHIDHLEGLTYLACRENFLKELVFSEAQNLQNLYCYNNQLSSLDLSHMNALTTATIYQAYATVLSSLSAGKYGIEVYGVSSIDNITDLKADGEAVSATLETIDAKTYLVFSENVASKTITFNYATGYTSDYDRAKYMPVQIHVVDKDALVPVEINATTFPNNNFRQWVLDNLDKDSNGTLSVDEIADVTRILIEHQDFESVAGIEYFPLLTSLTLQDDNIKEIDLSGNKGLVQIALRRNNLSSLDVSQQKGAMYLDCSGNQLTELNLSANTKLEDLRCYSNKLTMLDLTNNTALVSLFNASINEKQALYANMEYVGTSLMDMKLAIPVNENIQAASITDLKVNGEEKTFSVQKSGGKTYLVINMTPSLELDGAKLTYSYTTGYTGDVEGYQKMNVTITMFSTSYVLTVGTAKMATLYLSYDANVPSGLEAWYLKDINESTAIMFAYPITTRIIPAETAVFVTADAPGDYVFTLAEGTAAKITDNILEGTLEDIDISSEPAHSYLCLSHGATDNRIGFWWYNGDVLHAHRSFVRAANITSGDAAAKQQGYTIVFGDEENDEQTTVVRTVETATPSTHADAPMYNLAGQRVGKDYRGIVIVNGKKYVK